MKRAILAIAVVTSLAGVAPAQAQSAQLTDEDVIADCGNELRATDQDTVAQSRFALPGYIQWRDIHLKNGNTGEAALFQKNIDDAQSKIAELGSGNLQSRWGWLHWRGGSMVDVLNKFSAAQMRQFMAEERGYVGVNPQMALRACIFNLRIARLAGRSGPQAGQNPSPITAPPTRAATIAPVPVPPAPRAAAPRASAEPQFGGGASLAAKAVVADTPPVNQCVVPHAAGEKGNFGRLENVCGFPVNIRFCNDQTKPGSWEASMSCSGGGYWGGMSDVSAHTLSADHVGGHVYWFACRKPSGVTEAKFVPGKGITAHCR